MQVDLHLNGIICDDQGVKHRLNVSMLEREIEQQDFAVSQDIDALIASELYEVPLSPTGRFRVHAFNVSEHVIRRLDFGSTIIDNKTVMLKDIPHTILFSSDSGALLKCNIIFPKMYNAENQSKFRFSNEDQEFFYNRIFIKAANNVCNPSVLSRIPKSYRHALGKGIHTQTGDFMYGQDLINVINEMRNIVSLDSELLRFSGFFFLLTAFGFKQPFTGDMTAILSSIIDWSQLDCSNVYVDIATNLYNRSKPSVIFALKSKMREIGEVYGIDKEDKPEYFPHALSDFGGCNFKPVIFTDTLKPKKLICYSDVKNPFVAGKGLDRITGYYGKHWVPQDLWGDNNTVASVNVSKTK